MNNMVTSFLDPWLTSAQKASQITLITLLSKELEKRKGSLLLNSSIFGLSTTNLSLL